MSYERATVTLPFPVTRPDHWTEAASCAAPDVEAAWFDAPSKSEPEGSRNARIGRAKGVCARCPVTAECAAAIEPEDEGVRAGASRGPGPGSQDHHPRHRQRGARPPPARGAALRSVHGRAARLPPGTEKEERIVNPLGRRAQRAKKKAS